MADRTEARSLNGPMVARLRKCAADTSPNWDGKITIYPPEARELVDLIDASVGNAADTKPAPNVRERLDAAIEEALPVSGGQVQKKLKRLRRALDELDAKRALVEATKWGRQ